MNWGTYYQLRGMASTLRMRTAISPRQWEPWTAVSSLLGLINMVSLTITDPACTAEGNALWSMLKKKVNRTINRDHSTSSKTQKAMITDRECRAPFLKHYVCLIRVWRDQPSARNLYWNLLWLSCNSLSKKRFCSNLERIAAFIRITIGVRNSLKHSVSRFFPNLKKKKKLRSFYYGTEV